MKFLKYVFFLLLIAVIALAIYIAVQPNEFKVERTKTIKAPAELIYNNVSDFKNWEAWSSWAEADKDMKITLPEKTAGVDGSYSWEDKDGVGTMNTIEANPYSSLKQSMQFAEFPPSVVNWTFTPNEDGSTNVTWDISGKDLPFGFKAYAALTGGMEKHIGPNYERSLEKLDSIISLEVANKAKQKLVYSYGQIKQKELAPQKFIGYYQKAKIDHADLSKLFMEFMPKAGQYAMSKLQYGDFIPGAVYTNWDEESGETEFYIGLLLKKDLKPGEGMTAIDLPSGSSVTVSKFGNYGEGDMAAHTAIGEYMKTNNLTQNGPVWELYMNDPTTVKPEEIQTDIFYPVK